MNLRPPEIWLVSGPSRPERTALAARLAAHFERAARIDGEALREQIVAGRPDPQDETEAERQVELAIRNQCLLARSYAEAGFTPVLDFPVATAYHLDAYRNYLLGGRLHLLTLGAPGPLEGMGIPVLPDATPEAVLAAVEAARIS